MSLRFCYSLCGYLPTLEEHFDSDVSIPSQTFLGRSPKDAREAMTWALIKSMQRVGISSPNPNVGCIIVANGTVIAEGSTRVFGGLHAEREAIETCSQPELLRGATAFMTLEPCAHQGKQPPCTEALINVGIKRCIFGSYDPHPLVQGRGIERLKEAGIEVSLSEISSECTAFNLPFFFQCQFKRPFFVGKWAQTLNGLLADDDGVSQWISGSKSRKLTHFMRSKYDALLVGAGTIISDQPSLNARDAIWHRRDPLKILFDPSGRLLKINDSKMISNILDKTLLHPEKIVYVSFLQDSTPHWLKDALSKAFIIRLDKRDLGREIQRLKFEIGTPEFINWYGTPIQSVLVEGGASLTNYFLKLNEFDAFQFFFSPAFLSGTKHHLGMMTENHFCHLKKMPRYELLQSFSVGNDVYCEMLPQPTLERLFYKHQEPPPIRADAEKQ